MNYAIEVLETELERMKGLDFQTEEYSQLKEIRIDELLEVIILLKEYK